MTQFSLAELFGITIRESANDGSDFTNPSADYRRLFLGEDGYLHVKDSAGAVTDPYTSSGGVTPPQTVADPTTFNGTDLFSGANIITSASDVDAFSTKETLNSRVAHLVTKNASQDDKIRLALTTTKAGVFDIRTRCSFSGSYWSSSEDVYFEIRGNTSAHAQIFIARIYPILSNANASNPLGRLQKFRVGHTAITSENANVEPLYAHATPVTLRIQRDGSNVLSFSYGFGAYPLALHPVTTGSMVPYAPTSSGTLAEIDWSIHTPAGPGATAQWDAFIDYLTNN